MFGELVSMCWVILWSAPQQCRDFFLATLPTLSGPATLFLPSPALESGGERKGAESFPMLHLIITT